MCEPATIIAATTAVIGVASAAMSYSSQMSVAKAQSQAYQQNYTQNAQTAQQAAVQQYAVVDQRIVQEQQAATVEKDQSALEARKAAATTRVAAGEAGISGLSVEALLGDIYGQSAKYNDQVDQQTEWTVQQMQREKEGIATNTQDRINNGVQKPTIQRPNFIDLGLKITQTGLDSYTSYQKYKKP